MLRGERALCVRAAHDRGRGGACTEGARHTVHGHGSSGEGPHAGVCKSARVLVLFALWIARSGSGTGSTHHPTPYTLHPTPYTLHPTPIPSRPIPYTLHPPPPSTTHLSQVGPLLACHVQHPKLASRHYRSGRLQEAQARLPTCTTHLHHPPPRCTCRRRAHLQKTCAICLEECIGPSLGPAADGSAGGAGAARPRLHLG